jgi:hypothetical protein
MDIIIIIVISNIGETYKTEKCIRKTTEYPSSRKSVIKHLNKLKSKSRCQGRTAGNGLCIYFALKFNGNYIILQVLIASQAVRKELSISKKSSQCVPSPDMPLGSQLFPFCRATGPIPIPSAHGRIAHDTKVSANRRNPSVKYS